MVAPVMLDQKAPGAWYAVVLRKGYSAGRTAAIGAFGGKAEFPSPDLGRECVCCDTAQVETISFDASSEKFRCDPIAIPVCTPCRQHVSTNTQAAQLVAMAICAGLGLTLWAGMQRLWVVCAVGVAITAGCAWWILKERSKYRALAETGHFAGLEITGHPGQCAVRTMNRRVAMWLAQRHHDVLHRAR